MTVVRRARPRLQRFLLCQGLALIWHAAAAQEAQVQGSVVHYHIRNGDTLIGLAKRLLTRESLWRDLGIMNHVAQERRLRPGSDMQIPIPWIRWSDRAAVVLAVAGDVKCDGRAVAAGDAVRVGESVVTGPGGSIAVQLADGSEVDVPSGTSLVMQTMHGADGTDAPDIQLELPRGNLDISAQKHRDVGRFEIRTPTAVTAVRGTHYRTHFNDTDMSATAETLSGVIEVAAQGARLPVDAGYGTRADKDRPPISPVLLLPAPDLREVASANTASPMVVAFKPVDGALKYRIQVSGSENWQSLEFETVTTSPSVDIPGLADGQHWLRVRALDKYEIEGLDAVRGFTQRTLPAAPALNAPSNGAEEEGTQTHLSWNNAGSRYRLEVFEQSSRDSPVVSSEIDTNDFVVGILAPGRYVWRVRALNERGEAGPWSEERRFVERPAPPRIDSVQATRRGPFEIRWTPQPGYVAVVQLARDPQFEHPVREVRSEDPAVQLARPWMGHYFARVRWTTQDGYEGTYGPVREFNILPPGWLLVIVPAAIVAAALL